MKRLHKISDFTLLNLPFYLEGKRQYCNIPDRDISYLAACITDYVIENEHSQDYTLYDGFMMGTYANSLQYSLLTIKEVVREQSISTSDKAFLAISLSIEKSFPELIEYLNKKLEELNCDN